MLEISCVVPEQPVNSGNLTAGFSVCRCARVCVLRPCNYQESKPESVTCTLTIGQLNAALLPLGTVPKENGITLGSR